MDPNVQRGRLVEVALETVAVAERGWYVGPRGERVGLSVGTRGERIGGSRMARAGELGAARVLETGEASPVEVRDADCLDVTVGLVDEGLDPVCLNMANPDVPGGGYLLGARAQEEELFRRSEYALFLEDRPERPPGVSYPIPEDGGIYSPQVSVFRHGRGADYAFMDEPRWVSFLAIAAHACPPVEDGPDGRRRLTPPYADSTKTKIRVLFDLARDRGHDAVVASALGCGAFENPAWHVAELFRQVLLDEGRLWAFRRVVFAIFDDHNAGHPSNPDGNFRPFHDTLHGAGAGP